MMPLLRKLFWLAVFVASTLCFLVLFENGTVDFSKNFMRQVDELQKFVQAQINPGQPPPQP